MAESDDGPAFRVMREAAAWYKDENGLRALAREVGMSPSGTDKVVLGETQPRRQTLRKFRRWYLRAYEAGHVNGTGDASALIAIKLLVQDLPHAQQKPTALRVHEVLRQEFAEAGASAPRWLGRLKRLIETEWP